LRSGSPWLRSELLQSKFRRHRSVSVAALGCWISFLLRKLCMLRQKMTGVKCIWTSKAQDYQGLWYGQGSGPVEGYVREN
jgi:hypothetical protein